MQLIELAAQYRATGNALRARAATLRLELVAMPRAGRARRDLEARIARLEQMTGEDVTACAAAFCETVTAAGYDAAVYGNRWQGYYDYDFAQLKDYAFWVSAPGTADDFYYAHDFWQYSYDGTVPGVSGSVDRDLWFVPITT